MSAYWELKSKQLKDAVSSGDHIIVTTYAQLPDKYKESNKGGYGFCADDGNCYIIKDNIKGKKNLDQTIQHEAAHRILGHVGQEAGEEQDVPISEILAQLPEDINDEISANLLTYKAFGWPTAKQFMDEIYTVYERYKDILPKKIVLVELDKQISYNSELPVAWRDAFTVQFDKTIKKINFAKSPVVSNKRKSVAKPKGKDSTSRLQAGR